MDIDVRDSSVVWPVFRREFRPTETEGGIGKAIYHYMGVGVATHEQSAREMAISLCADETYFTFPSPANWAYPEQAVFPRELFFPYKHPKKDLRKDMQAVGNKGPEG